MYIHRDIAAQAGRPYGSIYTSKDILNIITADIVSLFHLCCYGLCVGMSSMHMGSCSMVLMHAKACCIECISSVHEVGSWF